MRIGVFFASSIFFLLLLVPVYAQEETMRTITGVVYDSYSGENLIGANILIQNTARGTMSDINGHFQIDVPTGRKVRLEISYSCWPVIIEVREKKTFYKVDVYRFKAENRLQFGGGLGVTSAKTGYLGLLTLGASHERHFKWTRKTNLVVNGQYQRSQLEDNGRWGLVAISTHLKRSFLRFHLEIGPGFNQVLHHDNIEKVQRRFMSADILLGFRLSYDLDLVLGGSHQFLNNEQSSLEDYTNIMMQVNYRIY